VTGLPPSATARPTRLEDAAQVREHLAAHSTALIGTHQYSAEGVANFLRDPALNLATDSWTVESDGKMIGTGAAVCATNKLVIEVSSADADVAGWLLDTTLARATEQLRATGASEGTVGLGIIHEDEQLAKLAAARGLTWATSSQRMMIEHTGPVDVPPVPAGIVVRRGVEDDAVRLAAHRVITESFADQPSATPRPYEEWVEQHEVRSTFDWSMLTVLELDGEPVAVRECDTNFVKANGCGYIGRIGVLEAARGRGLAKYLLRDAFAVDAAAGRSGTMLHVDSSNPTPAVGLYLSVGMRPDIVNDVWRMVLRS
jgi:ribosomal protein S18 acetylase RimI-like enzyme